MIFLHVQGQGRPLLPGPKAAGRRGGGWGVVDGDLADAGLRAYADVERGVDLMADVVDGGADLDDGLIEAVFGERFLDGVSSNGKGGVDEGISGVEAGGELEQRGETLFLDADDGDATDVVTGVAREDEGDAGAFGSAVDADVAVAAGGKEAAEIGANLGGIEGGVRLLLEIGADGVVGAEDDALKSHSGDVDTGFCPDAGGQRGDGIGERGCCGCLCGQGWMPERKGDRKQQQFGDKRSSSARGERPAAGQGFGVLAMVTPAGPHHHRIPLQLQVQKYPRN